MNKYKCFYAGTSIIVEADRSYAAQVKAAKEFKVKKTHLVHVVLLEVDGREVVHSTSSI